MKERAEPKSSNTHTKINKSQGNRAWSGESTITPSIVEARISQIASNLCHNLRKHTTLLFSLKDTRYQNLSTMNDQPFLFRYSSSNNGSLEGGYLAQERMVTLWTDPTPKDASAQEEEEKERILERNRFHWQNSHEYTNVIMTPIEFEEYVLQGLERPISMEPQDDLETFHQGFQRLQERYQTHSFPGILPISYHKDPGNPNREYRPMERAILTPTTSHTSQKLFYR